jgi:AraC-like DNA-binding protein
MQPAIGLSAVVFLIGAAQATFFAALLARPGHSNRQANRYLAALLLVFALALIDEFLLHSRYYRTVPQLLAVLWPLDFLYGPLFYFYTLALIEPRFAFSKHKLAHYIPFVLSAASYLPLMLLSGIEKADLVFAVTMPTPYHSVMALNTLAAMIQIPIYLLLAILHLRWHARSIRRTLSYREGADLRWLRNLTVVFAILWALYVLRDLLLPLSGLGSSAHWLLPGVMAFAVYALGYLGHRQPEIFSALVASAVADDNAETPAGVTNTVKYQKSALSDSQARMLYERLGALMQTEKPYRNSELSLAALAQQLGVSTHHLSQVINEHAGRNFFDFINDHRVRAAQILLADPNEQRSSILALSMEAGFKSKSAFYNAFRKQVGMPPAQYRAELTRTPNAG